MGLSAETLGRGAEKRDGETKGWGDMKWDRMRGEEKRCGEGAERRLKNGEDDGRRGVRCGRGEGFV